MQPIGKLLVTLTPGETIYKDDLHIYSEVNGVFHISLANEAKPFSMKTPRTVTFTYRDKLKAELETLQEHGVIAPVTQPTEWCAPIVVILMKGSENIRMCVDLSHFN